MLTVGVAQAERSWAWRSPRLCSLLRLCLPECSRHQYGAKLWPRSTQACHGQQGRLSRAQRSMLWNMHTYLHPTAAQASPSMLM